MAEPEPGTSNCSKPERPDDWKVNLYTALTSGDLDAVKELARDHDVSQQRFSIQCFADHCSCGLSFELDGPGIYSQTLNTKYSENVQEGHCPCVRLFEWNSITEGMLPEAIASITALHTAIKSAYPELVSYLLEDLSCSANDTTELAGSNGLHIAIRQLVNAYDALHGPLFQPPSSVLVQRTSLLKDNLVPIIRMLVEHGCDINLRDKSEPKQLLHGDTPLSLACLERFDDEVLNLLVDLGADVNLPNHAGDAPLHRAVIHGYNGAVAALLKSDCCKDIHTPLIVSREDPDYLGPMSIEGLMPLHHAAMKGDEDMVKMLLEKNADPDVYNQMLDLTPLMWCASQDFVGVAALLLKHGCSVNRSNMHNYSPLHSAAWGGFTAFCKLLLDNGALHEEQTQDKNTQLSLACHGGHYELVKLLLERPCDVNNADKDLDTPMHYAAFNGCKQTVSKLLECGAHVDPRNSVSATPLWNAIHQSHENVARMLLEYGASIETRSRGIDQLAETVEVTYCYPGAKSLLYVACDRMAYDTVRWLVLAGCRMNRETWFVEGNYPTNLRNYKQLLKWLIDSSTTPLSLLRLSRATVRSVIGCRLSQTISTLEIPKSLEKFLLLKEV